MERGRILIVGNSKETTYEIRNMLDHRRFELEIALSVDVGRSILTERWMHLIVLHTEILEGGEGGSEKLFEFMADRDIDIPILVLGEGAEKHRDAVPIPCRNEVEFFEKPYPVEEVISYIRKL